MWQPYQSEAIPLRSPRFLPAWVAIVIALAPLGLFPLLEIDPRVVVSDMRIEGVLIALAYPGWVAATSVRAKSVGPVIVLAALVPAFAIAWLLLTGDGAAAGVAGNLDTFIALALPPAVLAAVAYGLIELAVAVIGRIDPAGGGRTARSVAAALAGLVVSGAFVAVIGWMAYGVVGFRLEG